MTPTHARPLTGRADGRPGRRWRRRVRLRLALLAAAALSALALAPSALAFDTGPHVEITADALASEGFGPTATQVVQVNEWFVDLYENADKSPYSGHGGFWETLLGGGYGAREHWPQEVVDAADRTHFDATNVIFFNAQAITVEWERLQRTVYKLMREARDRNDPLQALTALGISLHQVQDFYSHTNWVERTLSPLSEGPDWATKGYGATPTWFDVRRRAGGGEDLLRRQHGRPPLTRELEGGRQRLPPELHGEGLGGAAVLPRGAHRRVLRHAPVGAGGAELGRRRGVLVAGPVVREHERRRPRPRRQGHDGDVRVRGPLEGPGRAVPADLVVGRLRQGERAGR